MGKTNDNPSLIQLQIYKLFERKKLNFNRALITARPQCLDLFAHTKKNEFDSNLTLNQQTKIKTNNLLMNEIPKPCDIVISFHCIC